MINLSRQPTNRPDDHPVVGIECGVSPDIDDDWRQLCAESGIQRLRRNRKTALTIHDCALLATRVAQNLDGRPSDGASALPRCGIRTTAPDLSQAPTVNASDSRYGGLDREHPAALLNPASL